MNVAALHNSAGETLLPAFTSPYELTREHTAWDSIGVMTLDDLKHIMIKVDCSKGTYIRTLCHDIGEKLGCGACMESLLRTKVDKYAIDNKLDDIVIFVYSKGLSTRINEIINNPKYKWFDEKLNEISKMTLQDQINYINDLFEQFADKEFEILYSIDNNNYSINEYYKNAYEARKFLYNSLSKNNEKIKSIELEHDNGDNIDFVVTFNDGKINKCNVFKDNNKWKIATMQEDSSSNQNDYLQNFKNEIQIVNDYFDKQTDVRIKWLQNDLSNKVATWFERINENREVITKEDKQWFGRLFVSFSKEEWFVHLKNAMKIIQDQQNKGCLI